MSALLLATANAHSELNYSCDDLGTMATRFFELKAAGHPLGDVITVIQQSSENKPDKEKLLSDLAIEIYLDTSIESAAQARAAGVKSCKR